MSNSIIISGVPYEQGGAPPPGYRPPARLPIEDLIKDDRQWSLYIQSTIKMQQTDPKDPLSWFQISGIHGYPFGRPWDGVPKPGSDANNRGMFCVHGAPNFPTWHRPYVLLFEQTLVNHAIEIAKGYNDPEWVRSAYTLRSPYWDWAYAPNPPPEVIEIVEKKQLSILKPDGEKHNVDNPLLYYKFPRNEIRNVGDRPTTVRTPYADRPNETNLDLLKRNLAVINGTGDPMNQRTYETLMQNQTWDAFSNKSASSGRFANSLESIHGAIHVLVGYFDATEHPGMPDTDVGHMAQVPFAAFDPIFWMHHTMVDRLISMWQVIHPGQWHAVGDENKALAPFSRTQGKFFHSEETELFESMNYTYPEILKIHPSQSPAENSAIMTTIAQQLYRDKKQNTDIEKALPPQAKDRLDWFARVRVPIGALKDTYSVMFFDGPPPEDPSSWGTASNFIGSHIDLVNTKPEHCPNCQDARDKAQISEGVVRLTAELIKKGIYGRPEEQIDQYLRDNLQWTLRKADGQPIDAATVTGLEVAVLTIRLHLDKDDVWRAPEGERPVHRNVTAGRTGGRGNSTV